MSFELPLSNNYRLTSDVDNVIVQHKITRKDGTDWQNIAYHQNIGAACEWYVRLVQRKSAVKGWIELQKLTKALSTDIAAIMEALGVSFSDTPKDLRA